VFHDAAFIAIVDTPDEIYDAASDLVDGGVRDILGIEIGP